MSQPLADPLATVATSALEPGTVIADRYAIQNKVADGAVASVYRAQETHTGQIVALKIIDPLRSADPVGHARFEREFEVLTHLSHPGIGRALGHVHPADLDVMVLEFIEGETLEARLARGRLPVEEATLIALRLAEAISVCHRSGILHRDLKPSNIILEPQRGPVILDFGMAWFSAAANLTRTGAVVGSPQYTAPEVFSSSFHDQRSDIYSLGAILFELLAGRPVHLADNVADLVAAHLTEAPPSVDTLRPEVPPTLARLVTRAIAPRAENRFATIDEFATSLRYRKDVGRGFLQVDLPCQACATPLIIDLPFCPGCGAEVDWDLTAGRYATQLDSVDDAAHCARWLTRRYSHALNLPALRLQQRLQQTPVPLVVGASRSTAKQLAAESRDHGCTATVVRSRAIIGARLKAADATQGEMLWAACLHAGAVLGLAGVMAILGWSFFTLVKLPALLALVGLVLARGYVRRPLLKCQTSAERARRSSERFAPLRQRLAALTTDRARRLAACAVARAVPVLLERRTGLPDAAREDVHAALGLALDRATALDAQAGYLQLRSRTRLAADITDARARAELHDPAAVARLTQLEQERHELTEASLAHDLASRQALEACQAISSALSTAVSVAEVDRTIAR